MKASLSPGVSFLALTLLRFHIQGIREENWSDEALEFESLSTRSSEPSSLEVALHKWAQTKSTVLELYGQALEGMIPNWLGEYTQLEKLDLNGNRLTGSIPDTIGKLVNLQELNLGANQLSGAIPDSLGNLVKLKKLVLSGNAQCTQKQFSGSLPSSLGKLVNLNQFHLTCTNVSGSIPDTFGNLSNLKELHLRNNNLTGSIPSSFGRLGNLQVLFLQNNQLSGSIPWSFGGLEKLRILMLCSNQLTGSIPDSFGSLGNLDWLDMSSNQLSGPIPDSIGTSNRLKHIDLHSNRLSGWIPESIGNLQELNYIDLSFNQLNGSIPEYLLSSQFLTFVDLSSNRLSGSLMNLAVGVNVQYFSLSSNQLSGDITLGPTSWSYFVRLAHLDLSCNQFTSKIMPKMSKLLALEELNLSSNLLEGDVRPLEGLVSEGSLRSLDLSHNHFSSFIPDPLLSLRSANLCFNNFSGQLSSSHGNIKCPSCKAGTYAVNKEQCELCEVGQVTNQSGLTTCSQCSQGKYANGTGLSTCQLCPAGKYEFHLRACKECPLGTFSSRGAVKDDCKPCGPLQAPDRSNEKCESSSPLLVLMISRIICFIMFFTLSSFFVGIPTSICDGSVTAAGCVIACNCNHFILLGRSVDVTFCETEHFFLNQQRRFLVKAHEAKRVLLLSDKGKDWTSDDPSIEFAAGYFYIVPSFANFASIGFGFPFWILPPILLVALFLLAKADPNWSVLIPAECSFAILVTSAGQFFRLHMAKQRSIDETICKFLSEVSGLEGKTDPGPNRAIALGSLSHLYDSFQGFLRQRTMYFLEPYLIRPLTRKSQLSFAELVGPKRLEYFVSHFWGLAFLETLTALKKHAAEASQMLSKPTSEIAYWICTFSNCQWKLWEEIPPGEDPESSSFFKALTSGFCNATCMVVNEKVEPLKRSWCLYELFVTFVLRDRTVQSTNKVNFQGLQLTTASGVLNSGKSSMDIAFAIAATVATIKLEDAKASRIEDEEMIKQKILKEYDSFEKPNHMLRDEIMKILKKMRSRTQEDIDNLLEALGTQADQTDDEI
jgi:Leucine-rich repeat (LRR) protein